MDHVCDGESKRGWLQNRDWMCKETRGETQWQTAFGRGAFEVCAPMQLEGV